MSRLILWPGADTRGDRIWCDGSPGFTFSSFTIKLNTAETNKQSSIVATVKMLGARSTRAKRGPDTLSDGYLSVYIYLR